MIHESEKEVRLELGLEKLDVGERWASSLADIQMATKLQKWVPTC